MIHPHANRTKQTAGPKWHSIWSFLARNSLPAQRCFLPWETKTDRLFSLTFFVTGGGLRTYEIAEHVGLSKPTVSHHLSIMKKAGIVSVERIGTVQIYHPNENTKPWKILSQLAWKAYRFVEEEASKETCQRMLTFGKERNIDGPDASN